MSIYLVRKVIISLVQTFLFLPAFVLLLERHLFRNAFPDLPPKTAPPITPPSLSIGSRQVSLLVRFREATRLGDDWLFSFQEAGRAALCRATRGSTGVLGAEGEGEAWARASTVVSMETKGQGRARRFRIG